MNINYLGKRGKLNEKLQKFLIENKNINLNIISACNFDKMESNKFTIYAARFLYQTKIPTDSINNKFIYLSTLSSNIYNDLYQKRKEIDSNKVLENGGKVIYIPFINEVMPSYIKTRVVSYNTEYYIYVTSIEKISDTILSSLTGISNKYILDKDKKNLHLNSREKMMYSIFSFLYKRCSDSSDIPLKLVKLIEKISHKIFFCFPLSCVYVCKEKK
ncbi:hypothetical protein ABM016_17440 [Morganella morganii]|uniref:hypothetical protein n=1 Tax=Morganella morganii TaxID=582 RepID=UPI0030A03D3B